MDGAPPAGSSCPVCGTSVVDGYRWCGGCGHRLSVEPATSVPPSGGDADDVAASPRVTPAPAAHRRRLAAAVTVVAVAAATVVVLRLDPAPVPVDAAARGDAGRTGVSAGRVGLDLARERWRDRWTQAGPRDLVAPTTPLVLADGDAIVTVPGAVVRLDDVTGEVRWRAELPVDGWSPPVAVDDRFVATVATDGARVDLLDTRDGTLLWSTPTGELAGGSTRAGAAAVGGTRVGAAAIGRSLVLVSERGNVVVLDLARGERSARRRAADLLGDGGSDTVAPAVHAAGDRVIVEVREADGATAHLVALDASGEVRWRSELPVRSHEPVVVAATTVVAATADGVAAFELEDGSVAWRWRAASGEDPRQLRPAAATPDGARVLLTSAWPIRRVLDADSGALVVSENVAVGHTDPAQPVGPTGRSGPVALVRADGRVEVVDVANGRTVADVAGGSEPGWARAVVAEGRLHVWRMGGTFSSQAIATSDRPVGGRHGGPAWTTVVAPRAACPVVAGGDLVLVTDGTVRAQAATDGARRWTADRGVPVVGDAAAAGGTVVSVDAAGFAVTRDAETGRVRWRAPAGGQALGAPAVVGDTVVVSGGARPQLAGRSGSGWLRGLTVADGERRWFVRVDGYLPFPPAVASGLVVVATAASSVEAVDLTTGEERWSTPLDGAPVAPPAVRGDLVVTTAATSVTTWRAVGDTVEELATTAFEVPLVRSPALTDDLLILRADASTVVALDPRTHEERWRTSVGDVLTTPPSVAGDRVLVGGQRGIHALDLSSGEAVGRASTGAVVGHLAVTDAGVVACTTAGELVVHG